MRKFFLFTAFICSTFLLSGCSTSRTYIIVNESDNEILVEYSLKESAVPSEQLLKPRMISLAEKDSWFGQENWEHVPQERFNFNSYEKKGTLKISPKEAVMIERAFDYRDIKKIENAFILKDLRIKDSGKEIYFENSKRLFEEFKRNDFEITYK